MVQWQGYEVYEPPFHGPLRELTPAEARANFKHVMECKQSRLEALERFAITNNAPFGRDEGSADAFGAWFIANVEACPTEPGRLKDHWYSIVFDMGLWLGDLIIQEYPELNWNLQLGGKRHAAFQKPVIAGYASDPRYSRDPTGYVSGIAHRAIAGKPSDESPIWVFVESSRP